MTPSHAEQWKCAGCGAPGLERSCDCVTDVVCLVTPSTHKHEPPRLSLPPCMMPDGGEACAAFHQQAKELEQARVDRSLAEGEIVLLRQDIADRDQFLEIIHQTRMFGIWREHRAGYRKLGVGK